MAQHARHGVADGLHNADALRDVHQRILRHHAFVHAVEGEQRTLWAPKRALRDAKLVAVHRLSADDTFGLVRHLAVVHVEVVLDGVGYVATLRCEVDVGASGLCSLGIGDDELVFLEVVNNVSFRPLDKHVRLVRPRELRVVEVHDFIPALRLAVGRGDERA